jgi:hypothetical protein
MNTPDSAIDSENTTAETLAFGMAPVLRFAGFFGGLALIAAGVAIAVNTNSGRGVGKLVVMLIIFGLIALGMTFRIVFVALTPHGIVRKAYWVWFFGGSRVYLKDEIDSLVLGETKGQFNVSVLLKAGRKWPIPQKWTSVKDAQQVIEFATQQYGTGAGVDIADQQKLIEAAQFSKARRLFITQRREGKVDIVTFQSEMLDHLGEVQSHGGWFKARRSEVFETEDAAKSMLPRWKLFASGKKILVSDRNIDIEPVAWKISFTGGEVRFWWTAPDKTVFSALAKSDNAHFPTFSMRFYRGLAEGILSASDRDRVRATQGETTLVAVADGPANSMTLDVVDDDAMAWVRLGIAAVWTRARPAV